MCVKVPKVVYLQYIGKGLEDEGETFRYGVTGEEGDKETLS